jgi:conjugal transfer/type IV secretion protein DotA/TraY
MAVSGFQDESIAPAPSQDDITVRMLDGLFGPGWPNYFNLQQPSAFDGVLFELLHVMNFVALSAVALISVYSVLIGVANTAYEGRTFGQRFHTVWAPVRWAFSIFLLFPLPAVKISVLQAFLLAATYWGIGLADKLWSTAVDLMASNAGHITISAVPPPLNQTTSGVLRSLTAQYYAQVQLGHSGGGVTCGIANYDFGSSRIRRIGTPSEQNSGSPFASVYTAYRTLWSDIDINVEQSGWGKAGTWRCKFTVPSPTSGQAGDTTADDLGYVDIYCPSGVQSPLCNDKVQGFQDFVRQLAPSAQAVAGIIGNESLPTIDLASITQAEQTYRLGVQRSLESALQDTNTSYGRSLQQFGETAKRYGWGIAGSWYWTMSRFNDAVNSAAEDYPVWNAGGLPRYVGGYEELSGYLGSASSLADRAGLATSAPTASDTNRAMEDIAAGPDAYNWLIRPMLALNIADLLTSNDDPLMAMQACGEFLLSAANAVLATQVAFYTAKNTAVGEVASFAAEKFTGFGAMLKAVAQVYGPYISAMLAGSIIVGMVFAVYLPMVPCIMWTIGCLGWLIVIGESLVAAPLWAATHSIPEGEGFAGSHARRGYMLALGVLLRPSLMVMGFFLSFGIMSVVGSMLTLVIHIAFAGLRAGNISGLFTFVALLGVTGGLLVAVVHRVFGIPTWIAEQVMRWIQGEGHVLGEQHAESHTRAVFGAVMQTAGMGARGGFGGSNAAMGRRLMPAVGNDGGDQNGHGSDSVSRAGGTAKPSNADLVPSLAGGSAGAASGGATSGATDGAAGASRDVGTRAASQITQPGGRSQ